MDGSRSLLPSPGSPGLLGPDRAQVRRRAPFILRSLREMPLTAFVPGEADLIGALPPAARVALRVAGRRGGERDRRGRPAGLSALSARASGQSPRGRVPHRRVRAGGIVKTSAISGGGSAPPGGRLAEIRAFRQLARPPRPSGRLLEGVWPDCVAAWGGARPPGRPVRSSVRDPVALAHVLFQRDCRPGVLADGPRSCRCDRWYPPAWVAEWLTARGLPALTSGSYYVRAFRPEGTLAPHLAPLMRDEVVRLCFKPPQE
jgi:hypothetical protein